MKPIILNRPDPRLLKRLFILSIIGSVSLSSMKAQVVNATVTPLSAVTILTNTSELPQSKVWSHAGKHFTVLGTSAGTVIMRLDGTTWTNVLTLASGNFVKADIKTVGDVVHVLVYKGSSSVLYSAEYVSSNATYRLWTLRKTRVDFAMEGSNQTATIDIDGNGRMWMASDGARDVNVRWSDAPYAVWSAPIKLETNTSTTDMCAVVALPGKIGVFWSNKVTKRFAFRTHDNGADPSVWSADEAPASQSALNVGTGFAENQFNLKVTSSGKLFVSIKTGYNSATNTQLALLVRETSGTWNDAYPVTVGSGQRPIVIINEALDVLKVVYTSAAGIVYKQSKLSPISFGAETTLLNGAYDNVTSAKNVYTGSAVVLASNASSAVGALIEDVLEAIDETPPVVSSINRLTPSAENTNETTVTYRAVFSEAVTGVTASDFLLTAVSGSVSGVIGGVTAVGGAGTTYDIEVNSITGFGTLRLDLASAGTGIADAAGNAINGGFNTGQTYIIAQVAPTLTSVAIVSNNTNTAVAKTGDVVTLSFTSSRSIEVPVVTIAGHSVTPVAQGGNAYEAIYTMAEADAEGEVAFNISFTATDGTAGVAVTETRNNRKVVFDKTVPTAESISRQVPTTENITGASVTFRIVFSEKVTGVNAADFTLTTVAGSVTGTVGTVTPVGSAGTTYDVPVSAILGSGTFRLDLTPSSTSITDAAGNDVNGGFNTGQTYTISQPAPVLNSVTIESDNSNSSLAKPGDEVTLLFTASGSIQPPVVTIAGHAVTATAEGGNTYEAEYILTASDIEGKIAFNIAFTGTNGTAGVDVNETTNNSEVIFDKTVPAVESINRQVPAAQAITVTSVTYRAVFSEKVTGVNAADFTLTTVAGSVTGTIGAVTSIGSTGTIYDVTVNSLTGNGTLRLDLKTAGTGIKDESGNEIAAGFTSGQTFIKTAPPTVDGFASVTPLTALPVSTETKDKPQSKVWKYNNKWWTILAVSGGTKVHRLDGTVWTPVFTLASTSSRCDIKVVGNVVHVLMYKGDGSTSLFYSLEHVPSNNTYKFWTVRPARSEIDFPSGTETANITIDGTGRLWTTTTGTTQVYVYYSNYPYSSWSPRIQIGSDIKDDDISVITTLPNENKISVLWSNQTTKRFSFRTHNDSDDPTVWSAEENPASQSALNVGGGMSDDHLNVKVTADGTLYCATKTSYNKTNYAKVALLVRRPNGVWDNLYTITMEPEGTQPAVIINEVKNTLKVVYCTKENGGSIVYRESPLGTIAFGPVKTLISNGSTLYDYTSSANDNYTSDIVILATNLSTNPKTVASVLCSDEEASVSSPMMLASASVLSGPETGSGATTPNELRLAQKAVIYPNPFNNIATLNFTLAESEQYSVLLYNNTGSLIGVIRQGYGVGGTQNSVRINQTGLAAGVYLLRIQTKSGNQTFKLIKK